MNLDPSIAPPGPPPPGSDPGSKARFGLQVAFGFFLPVVACLVSWCGMIATGAIGRQWSSLGIFLSGILGVLTLAAGLWLATQRRWKGALLGLILFGAAVVLLIGACFAMISGLGRK
jgi:hypothetical protein